MMRVFKMLQYSEMYACNKSFLINNPFKYIVSIRKCKYGRKITE